MTHIHWVLNYRQCFKLIFEIVVVILTCFSSSLTIGAIASEESLKRDWFTRQLSWVLLILKIDDMQGFRAHLEQVVWLEEAFQPSFARLANDLQSHLSTVSKVHNIR